jgi:hypothetical protein
MGIFVCVDNEILLYKTISLGSSGGCVFILSHIFWLHEIVFTLLPKRIPFVIYQLIIGQLDD